MSGSSSEMLCALCLEGKPLQNSHIIPEFLYSVLYDEKHRFNAISLVPKKRMRFEQKGAREKILCRECEQVLGGLERYASLVIKGGARGVRGERTGSIISVSGIDYARFKLFLISVLWRAGVAKGTYFQRVMLGPHEEKLRLMLLNGEPGPFDLYPCIFWGLNLKPGEVAGIMVQPCKGRVWGHTTYHIVLPGLKLVYFVSSQQLSPEQSKFVLQLDGSMVFQVRSVFDLPSVSEFLQKFES